MANALSVEMGETRLSQGPDDHLLALGLGACVGLCLYDPAIRLAALVHIVLPETPQPSPLGLRRGLPPAQPGKCADTAISHVLEQMLHGRARLERLQAALVGGAQIFIHSSQPQAGRLEIGPRNIIAVRAALAALDVPILGEDVGGHGGRTVTLCAATGEVFVRPIGGAERMLVSLGRSAAPEGVVAHAR